MRGRDVAVLLLCGALALAAFVTIALKAPTLGSTTHLLLVGLAVAAYSVAMIVLFTSRTPLPRGVVVGCLALAVAFRVPLWTTDPGRDTYRYVWDARVTHAGYNPYVVTPSDPDLAALHTDETRRIDHPDLPTPYPPGAQLFFRVVYLVSARAGAFKMALALCEVLLALVLGRTLARRGRLIWLLAYAWNPLVILVTAGEAHVDLAGALCLIASAVLLSAQHRMSSAVCFAMALAIKPLPIVVLPLYWRRLRMVDAAAAATVFALLCAPYLSGWHVPVGSLGVFIDTFRFNDPVFGATSALLGPRAATALAVAAGLAVAMAIRAIQDRRCAAPPPDGRGNGRGAKPARPVPPIETAGTWAWPMAVALLASPVVYPWYLVWLLPFATSMDTLPLVGWSLGILGTYRVWHLAQLGERWVVPAGIMLLEFGSIGVIAAITIARRLRQTNEVVVPVSSVSVTDERRT